MELRPYKCVIFDLDGTLLDTLDDLTDSVNQALSAFHFPARTKEEVRNFVGNGIGKLIERAVPHETNRETVKAVYDYFCDYYKEHCQDKTRPYDGIETMLDDLKKQGYKLAIVSNKADFAVKELNACFFEKWIPVAIGERQGVARKPAPDTVIEAMKELHMQKEDCIYVGDSDVDIKTAENAGLPCISVTWGFRDAAFLKENGAQIFASTPEEISKRIVGKCSDVC